MHPYQDQINRIEDLIKREALARKNGHWMESISLLYIILEVELRLLLSAKTGDSRILPKKIDEQRYIMNLADLAKDNGFIDESIWKRIREFNDKRKKAIHRLAQGEISYGDLEEAVLSADDLRLDIQTCWLAIKSGPTEKYPGADGI